MASVCFYFQVHQPYRLRNYTIFDTDGYYFDDIKNRQICRKVADKCYLPANRLMLELIHKTEGRFKIAYSITGTLLEQLADYAPEVLESFQRLADTGCVEFLSETYYHSLSSLFSRDEFFEQINLHTQAVERYFNQQPRVFRNTELIYNNEIARWISESGEFDGILAEGADHILGWRSPNYIYQSAGCDNLKLMLKNYRLSDDIAFRFSNKGWNQYPLNAEKYAGWINAVNGNGYVVNLFMDYETFGEHQWADTGIFDFMRRLPDEILRNPDNDFKTPSEAISCYPSVGELDFPCTVSWADIERDLSAWRGNPMQENALSELFALAGKVKNAGCPEILDNWRKLQCSDHFYYMCTKYFADGDVHKYFNPYESPYDCYIIFMNVLNHLNERCESILTAQTERSPEFAIV